MPKTSQARELEDELVTQAVIARRMEVSRQAVNQWTEAPSFPKPHPGVEGVKVWPWRSVVEWKVRHTSHGWRP